MKLYTIKGILTAQAETMEDIEKLRSLKAPARRYTVGNKRTCKKCGKKFKGLVGLNVHYAKAHGEEAALTRSNSAVAV